MPHLVIDYVLDGDTRGYGFTTSTDHLHPDTVKTIWRHAMPRGQGWNASLYRDARSLKCIALDNGQVAVSEVHVTGKADEIGRQGLRRAEITLLNPREYDAYLEARWKAYPPHVRAQAERKFGVRWWAQLAMPRMKGVTQIVLAHPYTGAADWQVIEAFIVKLALSERDGLIKGWEPVNPFTTLALDYREESRLVALPADKTGQIKPGRGVAVIELR